ncbi:hypothetical protein KUTeg_004467 [Tegillarca granosa]|uniref:Transposase MuDR plant domain-containing protein n=1 Tax=Tegillarca granosa TaxID=220873 RepID=A0ABQ9FT90_TEGGR|nr:hypothetical protein KUTeg_004467 [Tegillarca granosa]
MPSSSLGSFCEAIYSKHGWIIYSKRSKTPRWTVFKYSCTKLKCSALLKKKALYISLTCVTHPLSSMVFGTQACFVKPTISLSPMLVVSILNHYGYTQLKNGDVLSVDLNQLKHAMFLLIG